MTDHDSNDDDDDDCFMEKCITILDYTECFIYKSFKYVIPYYVLKTVQSEVGGQYNIGYFFGSHAFGSLLGAQTVTLSYTFKSNDILFMGDIIKYICSFIGYLMMFIHSDPSSFNFTIFLISMFLIGMSNSDGSHQTILKLYSLNNLHKERHLMIHFSVHSYISILVTSLLAPAIYQYLSFKIDVIIGCFFYVLYI